MKRTPLAIGVLVLCIAGAANAQDNAACVSAYEKGQVDRRAGHFDDARGDFATCTNGSCPTVVRERCVQFARDLEAAQPTMIVVVRDGEGRDVAGARVALDGAALAPMPPTALRVDPGEHVVRVEGGGVTNEQRVVIREGEKDRRIEITAARASLAPTRDAPRSKPIAAWAFAITGGVGLLGAGVMSSMGWGIYSNLSSSCGHACTDDQVAPLRVLWPAAFVSLGVGVVAAAIASVLFIVNGRHTEHVAWSSPGTITF